ncbi:MAG: hypothetical protein KJO40_13405 [Deltaproteobacteria bacterium]|nr:hypothetical protein [Deltaproteobacteria bacterium]
MATVTRTTAYEIKLTDREMDSLRYIAGRYEYANVLLDGLVELEDKPGWYGLFESDAWDFYNAVEEEDGYYPLAGGNLLRKLQDLEQEIV